MSRKILSVSLVFLELVAAFLIVVVVASWVSFAHSFNAWIPDHARIGKILADVTLVGGRTYHWETTPGPLYAAVEKDLSGSIVESTRIAETDAALRVPGERPREEEIGRVDSNFFSFFGWKVLQGDADSALADPLAVALSQSAARRYFGDLDPLGKSIWVDDGVRRGEFVVRAVFEDPPPNTTHELRFDVLIPIEEKAYASRPWLFSYWYGFNLHTFVKLREGEDPAAAAMSVQDVFTRHAPPDDGIESVRLHVVRLDRLHLYADRYEEGESSITTVMAFAAGAGLILFLAAGNFMLAISGWALDLRRGLLLHRMFGAPTARLLQGFLRTGGLLTALALGAASGLAILAWRRDAALSLLPPDPGVAPFLAHGISVAGIAAAGCLAIAMAGPVLIVLKLRPGVLLRGSPDRVGGLNVRATRPLVVLEFCGVAILVAFAMIMFQQLRYLARLDPGMRAEKLVVLRNLDHLDAAHRAALKRAIENRTDLAPATLGYLYPGHLEGDLLDAVGTEAQAAPRVNVRFTWIDPDFIRVYGIPLLAGRNLDPDRGEDRAPRGFPGKTHSVLINMSLARGLGFQTADAVVGRLIRVDAGRAGVQLVRVVGVLADALMEGPRRRPEPTVYNWIPGVGRFLAVRIDGLAADDVIARLERLWFERVPDVPFDAVPIDIHSLIVDDELGRQQSAVRIFSALALLVAAMGLLGLTHHMARQKTGPAAVRKLFGIPVLRLVGTLGWEFLQPVIWAAVVSIPVAWVLAARWLEGFAYRIALTPLPFIEALLLVLAVAVVTVSGHMIRLLATRPVTILREG